MVEALSTPSQESDLPLKMVHLATFAYILSAEVSIVTESHQHNLTLSKIIFATLGTIGLVGAGAWIEKMAQSQETSIDIGQQG